jgi:hypothetical protein
MVSTQSPGLFSAEGKCIDERLSDQATAAIISETLAGREGGRMKRWIR